MSDLPLLHSCQAEVVALTSRLDICSVNGGTVRGSRQGYDSAPGNVVLCPDSSPMASYGCRIVVQGERR